ncbi:ArsR/SmtB family transcription factor [Roseomonas sp. WA12]
MGRSEQTLASRRDKAQPTVLRLEKVLHALSDPTRLAIVVQLHHEGESSCAVLDGGRPKSTMSHHFRVLREAGVLQTTVHGVTHMNRLCREPLEAAFPGLLASIISAAGRVD